MTVQLSCPPRSLARLASRRLACSALFESTKMLSISASLTCAVKPSEQMTSQSDTPSSRKCWSGFHFEANADRLDQLGTAWVHCCFVLGDLSQLHKLVDEGLIAGDLANSGHHCSDRLGCRPRARSPHDGPRINTASIVDPHPGTAPGPPEPAGGLPDVLAVRLRAGFARIVRCCPKGARSRNGA